MASYETRRFSRVEYEKLIELGVFQPGEAVELLGGHLVVAEPQGAAHYPAIVKTARALQAASGPVWYVRTQGPIGLDDESEPAPDVAVVPGLYARAGVADYWIVSLVDRVVEVCRDPQADSATPFGWRYRRHDTLGPAAGVTPLAAPTASVLVSQLLS